jgi:hypothetical protein
MNSKFGSLEKRIKIIDIDRDEFFKEQPGTPFESTKGMKRFYKG